MSISIKSKKRHLFPPFTYLGLLGFIVFFFIVAPCFSKGNYARFVLDLSLMYLLILSVYMCSNKKSNLIIALFLAAPALLRLFFPTTEVDEITLAFNILFLAFVIGVLLHLLFTTSYVTRDIMCAALVVYFLIGIFYGLIFTLIECAFPGSFSLPQAIGNETFYGAYGQDLIYFSFIALTTTGYGDIVPLLPSAKFICVLEAITGQLYLAVMIARLIGMHISQVER
jgi:hypothetical protein